MKVFKNIAGRLVPLWSAGLCLALMTAPAQAQFEEAGSEDVAMTDYGTVTLTVKDTDLVQVLEMLAIQSRKNIIASTTVSATVSANLYDVTFYEALDAILRVNGYGYMEDGNFIYVYTQEELETIRNDARQTMSRVYDLEHLAAADANDIIQPLLSEVGVSSFRGDVAEGFRPDISSGGADSYAFQSVLIVNDYLENLDAIAAVLADVDVAPQQVLVEATILQTKLNEANAWGVDFSVIGSVNFTDLTNPLGIVNNLQGGNAADDDGFVPADNKAAGFTSNVGNTQGPGGLKIGVVNDDVSVFLRLLDEVTDNTILARPKIMCLNRQRAEVLVGARVGYLSTTATETTTTQTVEFLDTGIQLVFRPFISKSGMVRMELAPSVSEASLRTVTDANGLIVTIPDELTNELTTNVRVPDGDTLVLGGLFKETTDVTRRQVPFLGDIPLVGAAFRGQDDSVRREEIIFLITPNIVDDSAVADAGQRLLDYADKVRVGNRMELLPWSRDKMSSNYNQDAISAHRAGDTELALHYTNVSLSINEQQPEMIRFREQLTGVAERVPERSLMHRALQREVHTSSRISTPEVATVTPIIPGPRAYMHQPVLRPDHMTSETVVSGVPQSDNDPNPVETTTMTEWTNGFTTTNPAEVSNDSGTVETVQVYEVTNEYNASNGFTTTNDSYSTYDSYGSDYANVVVPSSAVEQQEFYEELFRSFFESLGLPEMSVDSVSSTEVTPADLIEVTSFDEMTGSEELSWKDLETDATAASDLEYASDASDLADGGEFSDDFDAETEVEFVEVTEEVAPRN